MSEALPKALSKVLLEALPEGEHSQKVKLKVLTMANFLTTPSFSVATPSRDPKALPEALCKAPRHQLRLPSTAFSRVANGIAGLASLLSACLAVINKVDSYKDFGVSGLWTGL